MVVDERNKTLFVCVYQMPVMLIRIHGIIIMIYMIFWGYHIRNNQTKKIGSGTFAVCKNHGTRQIFGHVIVPGWLLYFAVGREWHTANPLPCARYIAHGKGRLCRRLVVVCALPCAAHGKEFAVGFRGFTVCPWHTANGGSPVV